MFNNSNRVLFLLATILFYTAKAFYINPVYDYFNRNRRGPTTVCVQIQPNGAGSQEPYFICKAPEFAPGQTAQQQTTNTNENQRIHPSQPFKLGNRHQVPPTPDAHLNILQSVADNGYRQQNAKPARSLHADYSPLISSTNPQDSDNNNNSQQSSPGSSETAVLPVPTITSPEHETAHDSSKEADAALEAIQHNYNNQPEQHKALLDHEVLGAPDLMFPPDEMLSIPNLFTEPSIPLTPIPPEYYDDPVLRTFYSIDQPPHAEPFLPPPVPETKSVLQDQLLAAKNIIDYPVSSQYMPPPTELTKQYTDCPPFTFQPIFIAIPLCNGHYQDMLANMQAVACGQCHKIKCVPRQDHILAYADQGLHRSPTDDNHDGETALGEADLSSTKSAEAKTQTIEPQAENILAKAPESSVEDLLTEDTTIIADKAISTYAGDEDKASSVKEMATSTIRTPETAVKSVKSLLNAAKSHFVRYHEPKASAMAQTANKRHIPYLKSGVHPSHIKRQYVRKPGYNHHKLYY